MARVVQILCQLGNMVRRLLQNYYASCGSEKQKLTRFISLLYKNRLDFYVVTQNIDPIFITQKSIRFLLHKNRPDFYYAKIDPIFITQKSSRFLLYKNRANFITRCTKID